MQNALWLERQLGVRLSFPWGMWGDGPYSYGPEGDNPSDQVVSISPTSGGGD